MPVGVEGWGKGWAICRDLIAMPCPGERVLTFAFGLGEFLTKDYVFLTTDRMVKGWGGGGGNF